MRAVIDRKIYDTEKAEFIARWSNGHNTGDFQWCEEILYKSPKGTYFLYGEGGPMSKYSEQHGNSITGSDEIIVMSKDDVIEWLEDKNMVDEMEKLFPDIIQEG